MQSVPIEPSHKAKIESVRMKYGHESASHCFATLYIWKDVLGLSVSFFDDAFAVKCESFGKNTWFFPCGNAESIRSAISEMMKEEDIRFVYMREEDRRFLEENFASRFEIEEKEADFEYIYDREEQEILRGKKFSGMRNHINRAVKDNELTCQVLTDDNISAAKELVSASATRSGEDDSPYGGDKGASLNLLQMAKVLEVHGVLVYVGNVPYAVVAGYALSEDTFDMCLAKQKDYLTGLSVYAKHEFIKSLDKKYTKINAEEDLGIEGLRTMKRQMQPIYQTVMYEGRIKEDKE